jgi:hypothetical protein
MFPPEPPVASRNLPERSGAGKDARQRGEANPCRRAPFWHPTTVDGRWSGNSFPLVSSELLKFIHNPLSLNSASADSPYFHPHSLWSDCSGASWVSSIWKRVLPSRTRTECLCFQRRRSWRVPQSPELGGLLYALSRAILFCSRRRL